jgi:hypothetical protein
MLPMLQSMRVEKKYYVGLLTEFEIVPGVKEKNRCCGGARPTR